MPVSTSHGPETFECVNSKLKRPTRDLVNADSVVLLARSTFGYDKPFLLAHRHDMLPGNIPYSAH